MINDAPEKAVRAVCEMWSSVRLVAAEEDRRAASSGVAGIRPSWPGFAEALDNLLAAYPSDGAGAIDRVRALHRERTQQ